MRKGSWIALSAGFGMAALFAVVNADAFLAASRKPSPADLPKSGPVAVRMVFPDGTPAARGVVTIGRRRLTADEKGAVATAAVPAVSGVATGDATRMEGGFLGFFRKPVRYTAFSPVSPLPGKPLDVVLNLSPTPDIDARCRSCHPDKPTGAAPAMRCVHKSGVFLEPALAGRVVEFNKKNEDLRRAGKPYYPPIAVETRRMKKGFFGENRSFLTCESCHSNHVDTGYLAYVPMPFSDKSILCRGCHV